MARKVSIGEGHVEGDVSHGGHIGGGVVVVTIAYAFAVIREVDQSLEVIPGL